MLSGFKDWLVGMRLNGQHLRWLARWVRGITKDRAKRWYWQFEEEYSPHHFQIGLVAWPGLTYDSNMAGWMSMSLEAFEDGPCWMIHDVQVNRPRNQKRGIGTALVRASIALAQRHGGAQKLRGFVTRDDAKTSPFLPAWYAKLGFTVQEGQGDPAAQFWMDLTPSRPHPPLPFLIETPEQK